MIDRHVLVGVVWNEIWEEYLRWKKQLTVGNGGADAGEHEEERGDELGDIGLEGGGAERVA